ncbi:hypothetical protein ACFLTA_02110 [Bacteroidota bacterium]
MVRYLKHTAIDRKKWDLRIETAAMETLYPYSWYLDLVSPGWEGLVKGDYEMVMPLTRSRKFGFNFLLQPILAQQLGIFSENQPTRSEIGEFINSIPSTFRYIDICLNSQNPDLPEGVRYKEKVNHVLDLGTDADYNTNTNRNLQKGREHLFAFENITVDQYLDLKYSEENKPPVKRDYLKGLFGGLVSMKRAEVTGLFLEGDLQAAAVLGFASTRVIYMNGSSSFEGKENRAMFVMMDQLIESSRNKYPVFDFEGSNLPGVARFFEGFGAVKTLYLRIVKTKFPFFRSRR